MRIVKLSLIICYLFLSAVPAFCLEKIQFDFEKDEQTWFIPEWAVSQADCVGTMVTHSDEKSKGGEHSLEVQCEFPGNIWCQAVVEYEGDIDLIGYNTISADIYLPKESNSGLLEARFFITAGDEWKFIESRHTMMLNYGKWTRVTASFTPESEEGTPNWRLHKRYGVLADYLGKVRRIGIRIEYNANPWQSGLPYKGSVYIDNVVIE